MPTPKPVSVTVLPWLKANLGKRCLAPLTGTDARALLAAAQCIELYSVARQPEVLQAFGTIVLCMQEHTRELAYHAIAHVMEWPDRAGVWNQAGLQPIIIPRVCSYEPGGTYQDAA